jgi:hypothetical protein
MTAPRRRWSFTLRTLLIATAVCGGVLAWLVQQWRIVEDRGQTTAALAYSGNGWVTDEDESIELIAREVKGLADSGIVHMPDRPLQIPFIRRLLGDKPRHVVVIFLDAVDESEADAVAAKFPEAIIWRSPQLP